MVRVDHTLNDRNRIFGRYSDYHVDRQDPPWTSDPIAGNGNFATQYKIRGRGVALAWTDSISTSTFQNTSFPSSRLQFI